MRLIINFLGTDWKESKGALWLDLRRRRRLRMELFESFGASKPKN